MIEKIQMLRQAGRVSRNDYATTQAMFDEKYANADADTRAKVDGLLASSRNYSSANPMNNRSTREYTHHILLNAIEIMDGSYSGTYSPTASTPNAFNGYSHSENLANANYVTNRYLNQNNIGTSSASSATIAAQPAAVITDGYFKYNPLKGIDSRWNAGEKTRDELSENLISKIKANITNALNSNRSIRGARREDLESALAKIDANTWKNSFQEVMNIAELAGLDPDSFTAYYGDKYPGKSRLEINKKALQDQGFEFIKPGDYGKDVNNLITNNNYIVGKKDNKLYLINKDYSGTVNGAGKVKINTDYRNSGTYGTGFAIGDDGSFIYGDLNQYLDDQSSPWYSQLSKYIQNLGNDKRFGVSDTTFGKIDEFKDPNREALIDKFGNELVGKFIGDVSSYFNGADVIVTSKNNNLSKITDRYGNLRLDDPNLTFYYKDGNTYQKGNLEQVTKSLGDINFNYDKERGGFEQFTDLTSGLSGLSMDPEFKYKDLNGRGSFRNDIRRGFSAIPAFIDSTFGTNIEANISTLGVTNKWDDKRLNESKDVIGSTNGLKDSARFFLYLFKNPDEDKQIYRSMLEDPENRRNVLALIEEAYRTFGNELFAGEHEKEYSLAYRQLMRTANTSYSTPVSTTVTAEHKKQGGVLKAETGYILNRYGNPAGSKADSPSAIARENLNRRILQENAQIDRAREKGNSVLKQATIEDNKWTASDTLRMTALATDVAGLVAAMTGPATVGAGSIVAVGSGILSMAQDAIADFTDDKVSAGEAWRNIGLNTGLAAAAAVGGKAPKIISRIVKYLPKVLMVAGTAGLVFSPEVQESVGKAVSGKHLNVNDWKNISYVLRTATGFGTIGTMKYKQKKGLEIYKGKVNENLKKLSINSYLDPNLKYISNEDGTLVAGLSKEKYNALAAALKKKDGESDAIRLIREANPNLDDDTAKTFIKTIKGQKSWKEKAKFWKESEAPDDTYALNDIDVNTAKGIATGPDVYSAAKMQAIADIRNQARTAHGSAYLNKLEANPRFEAFNPALGAAMNEAQAAGWTGKNINELLQYNQDQMSPFGPTRTKTGMTDAEFMQLRKDQLLGIHYDAEVQNANYELGRLRRKAKQSAATAEAAANEQRAAADRLLDVETRTSAAEQNLKNVVDPNKAKAYRIREIRAEIQELQDGKTPQSKPGQQLSLDFDNPADRQLRIADLQAESDRLMSEIRGSKSNISQANADLQALRQEAALRQQELQFRQNRLDLINRVNQERGNRVSAAEQEFKTKYSEASMRDLNQTGKDLGTASKDAVIKVNNKDVLIKAGSTATSFQHIRNAQEAEAAAKYGSKKMVNLSKENIAQLLPSNLGKIRGAAIDSQTGNVVVWKHGGKMNGKYNHLRK